MRIFILQETDCVKILKEINCVDPFSRKLGKRYEKEILYRGLVQQLYQGYPQVELLSPSGGCKVVFVSFRCVYWYRLVFLEQNIKSTT